MDRHLSPTAREVAEFLGVGEKVAEGKMFEQFTEPIYEIMNANLKIMLQQEGSDKEGYALRLGIILAKLDLQNPLPIKEYDSFFTVLSAYLEAT